MANDAENDAAINRIEEMMRLGALEQAEGLCREVLSRNVNEARAWVHLGLIRLVRGATAEGEYALRQAVVANPNASEAWNNLSAVLFQQGKLEEGAQCAVESLRRGNATASPWVNLGHIAVAQKDWNGGAEAYRRAVAIDSMNFSAWGNLATCEQELGNGAAAEAAYQRGLQLVPQDLGMRANYGWFLTNRGQAVEALDVLAPALVEKVEAAGAWTAVGHARSKLGDRAGAEEAYRKALTLAPQNVFAKHGLAVVLRLNWKLADAESLIKELINEQPNFAPAWVLWAGMQSADQAKATFRRAIELQPKAETHSAMLMSLQYASDAEPQALLASHREWAERYARPLWPTNPPVARVLKGGERLRLGFVSAGFGRHPVGFLGLPAIERLDRTLCEVVCYSDKLVEDELTERFKRAATEWKVTAGISNEELAEIVRRDRIDVLFDLGGHTEDRMQMFARKPAALQISWLGYVGTTGMEAMDCVLADRFHVRAGEEVGYVEKVLRMPKDYVCYGPPEDSPEVNELPALKNGFVTFGSFNNPAKLSSLAFDLWAEVLRKVPGSRFFLKYGGLDQPEEQERYRSKMAERGIGPERVLFSGWSDWRGLLAAYRDVDIALDTQPYSGGLTTCEATWMGVPVITCPGRTFAGRHSTSHLTHAGLAEFVASDREGYVELAVKWAGRMTELAELRQGLRARVRGSDLCNAAGFARDFLRVVREEFAVRAGTLSNSL
jgi:protein O-GlcNAc transferase